MTKRKSTKSALLSSALALFLCFTMLLGTTYAWFTDSVTSANNVIKSGTLDVEMYWAKGTEDPNADATAWEDASKGAIFNNDKWEPGYVEVRHIKISNVGTLSLKYQLHIAANGDVSDLADVIDVYFVDPAVQVSDRTALDGITPVGTLTEVLAGMPGNASGDLLANTSDVVTLAFKMREEAGNEYQNKAIGSDFAIQLLATQLTSEKDSFDDQYDAGSEFYEVNENASIVNNNAILGEEVVLTADMPYGTIKVTVPAGAQLSSAEVASLKLTVKKAASGYNGMLTENQVANGYEIYVDGISDYKNPYIHPTQNRAFYNYKAIVVNFPVGAGRHDLHSYADGSDLTMGTHRNIYAYDPATGVVTFGVSGFSDFSKHEVSNITFVYTKLTEAENILNEAIENLTNGGSVSINSTSDNMVTVNNIADALNGSSNIILVGESKENTVLMANDATITADGLTMKNMTIQSVQDLVIKGNDTTIENVDYQHGIGSYGLTLAGSDTTIKDTTVSGSASQGLVWYSSASDTASSVTTVEGTTIKDTSKWGASNGITFQNIAGTFDVKDCDISVRGTALQLGPNRGITQGIVNVVETDIDATGVSISTVKTSTFDNVSFANTWSDSGIRFTLGGQTNTFASCDFKDDVNFISGNYSGKSVTLILNNCTYNGAAITAENVLDHFAFNEATWGLNVRDNLTLIVNGTTVTVPQA
ncbi:MAG: SipW-dependent-type signal peptide-containing protein [Clostridia bacterium]|nr:SipW-dependent-type signal peptide-containing protein [Clostridia bacterium]